MKTLMKSKRALLLSILCAASLPLFWADVQRALCTSYDTGYYPPRTTTPSYSYPFRIIMDRPMMVRSCAPASAIMTLTDRATTAVRFTATGN